MACVNKKNILIIFFDCDMYWRYTILGLQKFVKMITSENDSLYKKFDRLKIEKTNIIAEGYGVFPSEEMFIDLRKIFYAYNLKFPSVKSIEINNLKVVIEKFESYWEKNIEFAHYTQKYCRKKKRMLYSDLVYILNNKIAINFTSSDLSIAFDNENEVKVLLVISRLFKRSKTML